MGLLHRNRDNTKEIITICPSCHKELTIFQHPITSYYLDGMPHMSVANMLETMIICDNCFFPVPRTDENFDAPVQWIPPDNEMAILSDTHKTMVEKKMALLELYNTEYFPMWYAHYYNEQGNVEMETKWLHIALGRILNGIDKTYRRLNPPVMFGIKRYPEPIHFGVQHRLVELYRRLSMWDEAQDAVQQALQKFTPASHQFSYKYFTVQEQLIAQQDNHLY